MRKIRDRHHSHPGEARAAIPAREPLAGEGIALSRGMLDVRRRWGLSMWSSRRRMPGRGARPPEAATSMEGGEREWGKCGQTLPITASVEEPAPAFILPVSLTSERFKFFLCRCQEHAVVKLYNVALDIVVALDKFLSEKPRKPVI